MGWRQANESAPDEGVRRWLLPYMSGGTESKVATGIDVRARGSLSAFSAGGALDLGEVVVKDL